MFNNTRKELKRMNNSFQIITLHESKLKKQNIHALLYFYVPCSSGHQGHLLLDLGHHQELMHKLDKSAII